MYGFADAHLHITADMRAGGRVIYGKAFDRDGIAAALGHDADDHGPNGILDITGNLLRSGLPVGTHDTGGWPTFAGWPTHDTITHQQIYYRWLQRAWLGGERLVVAQTVEDEPLCRSSRCARTRATRPTTIELQVARLRAPRRRYVDAQRGGPGRGWFRLVEDPAAARRAIEDGKLAVVIGVESSNLFGCSESLGSAAVRPRRHRPRHRADCAASACAACSSPTGSTTRSPARRSRAATRVCSSACMQITQTARLQHRPVPGAGPGRGGGRVQHPRA